MPKNSKTSIVSLNAALNGLAALCNSGKLRIYDGAQPATPETAITTQNLLSELTMNATAFASASGGVIVANSITQDSSIAATGTAAWYRLFKSDGTTPVLDGTVGTADADCVLNSVDLQQGAILQITSFQYRLPQ